MNALHIGSRVLHIPFVQQMRGAAQLPVHFNRVLLLPSSLKYLDVTLRSTAVSAPLDGKPDIVSNYDPLSLLSSPTVFDLTSYPIGPSPFFSTNGPTD